MIDFLYNLTLKKEAIEGISVPLDGSVALEVIPPLTLFLDALGNVTDIHHNRSKVKDEEGNKPLVENRYEVKGKKNPRWGFPTSNFTPTKPMKKELSGGKFVQRALAVNPLLGEGSYQECEAVFPTLTGIGLDYFGNLRDFFSCKDFVPDFRDIIRRDHPRVHLIVPRLELFLQRPLDKIMGELLQLSVKNKDITDLLKQSVNATAEKVKYLFQCAEERRELTGPELSSMIVAIKKTNQRVGRCVLSGKWGPLVTGGFPDISGLNIKPYSSNSDEICNMRYGHIGFDSLDVSSEVFDRIKACVESICRRDKVLCINMPLGKLLVYPSAELLNEFANIDDLFGNIPIAGSMDNRNAMRQAASCIGKMMRRVPGIDRASVDVLLFTPLSPGVGTIELNETITVGKIHKAYSAWLDACRLVGSKMLFALNFKEFSDIFTGQYRWNNTRYAFEQGKRPLNWYTDSLRFFLGEDSPWFAKQALTQLYDKSSSVLRETFEKMERNSYGLGKKEVADVTLFDKMLMAHWVLITRIMTKEEVMASKQFILGRAYRLANDLHMQYSRQQGNAPGGFGIQAYNMAINGRVAQSMSHLGYQISGIAEFAERELVIKGSSSLYGKLIQFRKMLGRLNTGTEDEDMVEPPEDEFFSRRWTDAEKVQFSLGFYSRDVKVEEVETETQEVKEGEASND